MRHCPPDAIAHMIESAERVLARAEQGGHTRAARIQRDSLARLRRLGTRRGGTARPFGAADVPSNWGARVRPAGRNVDTRERA